LWRFGKAQARYLRIALTLFWRSLLLLGGLWGGGAALFYFFAPWGEGERGVLASLWAALALMAAEPSFAYPEAWPLQVAYFVLPVAGLLLVAHSVVRFSLLLVDKRSNEKEWMEAMAATARDHVILCGLGSVGFRVLEELLALGQEVVAIEKSAHCAYLNRAKELGATVLVDDATVEAVLERAGLAHAKAVIAATNNDISNLEIVLDARRMKPGVRVVMRIFDQNTALKIREAFRVETLSSSSLSAPTFALAALAPDIVATVRVGEALLVTAEIDVLAGSSWDGALRGTLAQAARVVVVASRRGEAPYEFAPELAGVARAGDRLLVQGIPESITAARRAAGHKS
jgi:Trk K+ transport system NAD-binding subunit